MRVFAVSVIISLALAGTAAACLTPSQEAAITAVAQNSNVTPATLLDIFAVLCNRSYTKGETDIWRQGVTANVSAAAATLQNANATISAATTQYLDNYTAYMDSKFSTLERMELVANLTNESISLNRQMLNVSRALSEFEAQKEKLSMTLEALFDDKTDELRKTLKDYVHKDELPNYTVQPMPVQQVAADYTPYIALAVVVAGLVIWKMRQKGVTVEHARAMQKLSKWRSPAPAVQEPLPQQPQPLPSRQPPEQFKRIKRGAYDKPEDDG